MHKAENRQVFRSRDLAKACGLSRHTARRYLAKVKPLHKLSWYSLDAHEFAAAIADIERMKTLQPHQPLRVIRQRSRT